MGWVPMLVVALVLGVTGLGYLQVPGVGGALTLMHLPVILAGMLSGPLPGALVGFVFGISSWIHFPPHDALVQVVPRVLIGVVSAVVFETVQKVGDSSSKTSLGAAIGALAGSLTNTLGVSMLVVLRGLFPADQLLPMALFHGSIECLLAVLLSVPLVVAFHHSP